MAYYLYVPNSNGKGGTIVGSWPDQEAALCEQAISGGQIVEAQPVRQAPRREYINAGWKKCATCGCWTPPWHGVAPTATSEVASESEGGK